MVFLRLEELHLPLHGLHLVVPDPLVTLKQKNIKLHFFYFFNSEKLTFRIFVEDFVEMRSRQIIMNPWLTQFFNLKTKKKNHETCG